MEEVLNPALYSRLLTLYNGDVGIVNQGEQAALDYMFPPTISGSIKVTWKLRTGQGEAGENYTVNCPYCKDNHKHMYISYLSFSAPDIPGYVVEKAGLIVNCFHGCFNNRPDRREHIAKLILGSGTQEFILQQVKATTSGNEEALSNQISLAGIRTWAQDYQSLDTAPPEVVRYITEERRYTIPYLMQHNIGWGRLLSNKTGAWLNRGGLFLIIPIIQNGTLRGIQGRAIGSKDQVEGAHQLRYYFHPACKKSAQLGNIDQAVKFRFCCGGEGFFDALRFGGPGVCFFGPYPSKYQEKLLLSRWGSGAFIWCPDTNVSKKPSGEIMDPVAIAQGYIDKWNSMRAFAHGAHLVRVSAKDPDEMTTENLWKEIQEQTGDLVGRLMMPT